MEHFFYTLWDTIKINLNLKISMAFLLAVITKLFGTNYIIYEALVILVAIDFVTELISSVKRQKKISSRDFKAAIYKMTLYGFFMAATYQLQRIVPSLNFLELAGISFLAITEFLSIVENLSSSGLIIPRWIVVRLEKYLETGQIDIIQDKNLKRIKT